MQIKLLFKQSIIYKEKQDREVDWFCMFIIKF